MSGYIGPVPVPQSIQRRQSFTATAGQTTFGTTGYTDGDFIDVYLNGVKLVGGTDYTATNGSDIVLTSAASASDVLDFVTFNSFQLVDQTFTGQIEFDDGTAAAPSITNTGDVDTGIFFPAANTIGFAEGGTEAARIDSSGNLLVGKTSVGLSNSGVELREGAASGFTRNDTVMDLNRTSSDGQIMRFRKDGTSIGAIGSASSDMVLYSSTSGHKGIRLHSAGVLPTNNSGALEDNASDLGSSTYRFNDLYLGGGAYLGGTGSANKLDDYEEGTWTPAYTNIGTGTYSIQVGYYVKIGNLVNVQCHLDIASKGTASGNLAISGFPFVAKNVSALYGISSSVHGTSWTNQVSGLNLILSNNSTTSNNVYKNMANTSGTTATHNDLGVGNFLFSMTYYTQ